MCVCLCMCGRGNGFVFVSVFPLVYACVAYAIAKTICAFADLYAYYNE